MPKQDDDANKIDAFAGVETLVELNQEFARSVANASKAYLQAMMSMQEEMIALVDPTTSSTTAPDAVTNSGQQRSQALDDKTIRIQQCWARKVSETYICEAERLVGLASETSKHTWSPILAKREADAKSGD